MKDYNMPLTDEDLRDLLRGRLMTHDTEDLFTQQLMNMEAKIAFADVPFLPPSLQKEKQLLKSLNKKFANPFNLKWLFTGLSTATIIAAVAIAKMNSPKQETISALPTPIHQTDTKDAPQIQQVTIPDELTDKSAANSPPAQQPIAENTLPLLQEDKGLNLYNDLPLEQTPPAPQSVTPSLFPNNETHTTGILKNLSGDKDQINVDTIFSGIKQLEVNGLYCSINVKTTSEDRLTMKGEMKYEMRGLYVRRSDFNVHFERNGTALKIWVENEGKNNSLIIGSLNFEGFLNFEVPEKTEVVLKNTSGDITASGLKGNICSIETSYGNIKANDIGTNTNIKSVSGSVSLSHINGKVHAIGSFGNMDFTDIKGDLKATCASGGISLMQVDGDADIEAKYGNIKIEKLKGLLKVSSSSGNVNLDEIAAPNMDIRATYGHIKIINAKADDVKVISRSGNVSLDKINGDIMLTTTYGNQHLHDITGNITTSSTSGSIDINRSFGALDINAVYGNVNLYDCVGKMIIYVQSGDIIGKNIELNESLSMRSNYGNIRMNLKNNINDLSFDLASTSGNLKIEKDGLNQTKEDGSLVVTKGKITIKGVTQSGDQFFY